MAIEIVRKVKYQPVKEPSLIWILKESFLFWNKSIQTSDKNGNYCFEDDATAAV
jgi:hypothetical protein